MKIFSICHRCQRHRWCILSCEYFVNFRKILNAPNNTRGLGGKLIHKKNLKSKISWHCPFKDTDRMTGVQEEEVKSRKRELEVLVEEEARLGSSMQASQAQIQALIRTLADIDFLLGETRSVSYIVIVPLTFLTFLALLNLLKGKESLGRSKPATNPSTSTATHCVEYFYYIQVLQTVWRIRDVYPGSNFFPSRIPDPNCLHSGSRILDKEFKYFNPKKSQKMVSRL
jgi:hypothetical protein